MSAPDLNGPMPAASLLASTALAIAIGAGVLDWSYWWLVPVALPAICSLGAWVLVAALWLYSRLRERRERKARVPVIERGSCGVCGHDPRPRSDGGPPSRLVRRTIAGQMAYYTEYCPEVECPHAVERVRAVEP